MDTTIEFLGEPKIDSPLRMGQFVENDERILFNVCAAGVARDFANGTEPVSFLKAGPRRKVFFDTSKLRCAIVTCGGLCPGLNNVIRSLVLTLHHSYGVTNILGIKYGLQGFIPRYGHPFVELTPESVSEINELGGTILGSSRGPQDMEAIVDALVRSNIRILFAIGGDGTFRAVSKMTEEIRNRRENISVVGIPKTIDNDILYSSRSFGFNTAVGIAAEVIGSAHVEALGAPNGIGLVKLMGRHSGFIAASAALDKRDANFVLIPESDFDIEGPHGLLQKLGERILDRRHAVIVVAEGAGQRYCAVGGTDESGNVRLGDIGLYLKDQIQRYFESKDLEINLKYIDPSYLIRSVPATPNDSVFCGFLAQNAVHAGMAGKTNMMVGTWNDEFVYVPINLVVTGRKQVDLNDKLWRSVLEATGQPPLKPEE
ncbi:MAG: ATP-dependent 6-phosphofructokinase [Desulfomonilaceae bacterium]|nr:ATP-dependent 6-phosphofructokinase [Desulfomonilaceae bacterium]